MTFIARPLCSSVFTLKVKLASGGNYIVASPMIILNQCKTFKEGSEVVLRPKAQSAMLLIRITV